MTWLSKLFGKSHDKIKVSEANDRKEKSSSAQSRPRKKPTNRRGRTNSVVMRQKMQKKIAESAKERVLDKRRTQKVNLQLDQVFEHEFRRSDIVDSSPSSRFDFRADPVRARKNNLIADRRDLRSKSRQRNGHDSSPTKSSQPHDESDSSTDDDQPPAKETNQISSETNLKLNDLNGLVYSY